MLIELKFFVWFSYEFLRILILTFLPAKMFVIWTGFLNCTNDFLWGSHFHCLTTSDFIFSANLKCKSGRGLSIMCDGLASLTDGVSNELACTFEMINNCF